MGNIPILIVAEPELIKTILVKDFHLFPDRRKQKSFHLNIDKNLIDSNGEDWKRIRTIVSPTFTSGKMKKMYPIIKECVNEFMDVLEVYAKDRKSINAKEMFGNLTLDVISTCAFATKTNAYKDINNPFIVNIRKMMTLSIIKVLLITILPSSLTESLRPLDSVEFFKGTTRQLMKNRRNSDKKYNDFIQLLIDAENNISNDNSNRDESDVNESHYINEGEEELEVEKKALKMKLANKQLTLDEIFGQTITFFVAGYETTATTLTFASYELAVNPLAQKRLYSEVNAAIDSKGDISYEELAKLPYLDAVLSETLRLHSPALHLQRMASTDYELGETGIKLSKGQQIEIPVYAIHLSEDFYENPFEFRPERFLPENRHKIKPYTYLPFGAGPRNCIGMRFALLEAKFALAQIIKRFNLFRNNETDVPLSYKRSYRLLTSNSAIIGIEEREK